MPANIEVRQTGDGQFQVIVSEAGSQTSHRVTVGSADHARLTGGKVSAEELVRHSFEFLLEREPKEAILGSFDLTLIGRYFPEYEEEIQRRLGGRAG